MRQVIGIKIPFSKENAGKRICWNCPEWAKSNCTTGCPGKQRDSMKSGSFDDATVQEVQKTDLIPGSEDADRDEKDIWELVRFLVTTA